MHPRWINAFVVLVVAASSCTSRLQGPVRPPMLPVTDVAGWHRADLSIVGLSTGVPDGWHVQRVDDDLGIYRQYALIVSNEPFDVNARSEDQFPTLWDMSRQPPNLVAVMLGNDPVSIPCHGRNDATIPTRPQRSAIHRIGRMTSIGRMLDRCTRTTHRSTDRSSQRTSGSVAALRRTTWRVALRS